ncbi:MAM and LDL-receptor class A domain-containing protein 1-like [Lytechinus pictus]|uniref:MAM and LDL-receptor class A domain-containing protein 1-like n=1 Tax=Lytechinus pictus TaxID=7653 RepID=UPI0030B9FBE2
MWPSFVSALLLVLGVTHPARGDANVPNFDCNFDTNKCGWQFDLSNRLTWAKNSGPTTTPRTGPSGDHTTGSGFYMYIETASASTGDKATLISPTIPALGVGSACVTFWYHMLGSSMGKLTVYNPPNIEKWKKLGNQGNQWIQARVSLQSTSSSQMYITGEIGGPHYSDMAIDDISIQTGNTCPDTSPDVHDCDFDKDFCAWTPDMKSTYQWIRAAGPTDTRATGPVNDHTKGDETGYYIYVESTGPKNGDSALLVSSLVTNSENGYCMNIWYHMFGATLGSLNIYRKLEGGNDPRSLIWRETQPRGPQWNQAQLHFMGSDPYRLMIEGTVVTNTYDSHGDIAVDDIQFHDGKCPTPRRCDFENGDCNYTPGSGSDFTWNVIQPSSAVITPSIDVTYRTNQGTVYIVSVLKVKSTPGNVDLSQ